MPHLDPGAKSIGGFSRPRRNYRWEGKANTKFKRRVTPPPELLFVPRPEERARSAALFSHSHSQSPSLAGSTPNAHIFSYLEPSRIDGPVHLKLYSSQVTKVDSMSIDTASAISD
jgi:hypothetical protein